MRTLCSANYDGIAEELDGLVGVTAISNVVSHRNIVLAYIMFVIFILLLYIDHLI